MGSSVLERIDVWIYIHTYIHLSLSMYFLTPSIHEYMIHFVSIYHMINCQLTTFSV